MKRDRSGEGFSSLEISVALGLIVILIGLLALTLPPLIIPSRGHGEMMQTLSNMKQLQLATQAMTLDFETANTPSEIHWTCTNGHPLTYAEWAGLLVRNGYLSKKDLVTLTTVGETNFGIFKTVTTNAFNVYAVSEPDADSTLFLSSRNWHGPNAQTLSGRPFETKGFVVFRKGGDGAIIQARQCQQMDFIGSGGKFNYLPLQ